MSERTVRLRAALQSDRFLVAPGVYDMVSAMLADRCGFDLMFMTGYGVAASHLGLPDAGLITYTEMLARLTTICGRTGTPLIGDGDTGYGGLLNVAHTVSGYERAGAAGIQLEDQEFPKRCGHEPGRRCVSLEDMVAKIRVAVEARVDPDFVIVARTDALAQYDVAEALRRIRAYAEAGADALFVEAPESVADMKRLCRGATRPMVVNMVEGGRTPVLAPEQLRDIGYRLALHPAAPLLAAARAMDDVYRDIRRNGTTIGQSTPQMPLAEMTNLMGFQAVRDFERRHAS